MVMILSCSRQYCTCVNIPMLAGESFFFFFFFFSHSTPCMTVLPSIAARKTGSASGSGDKLDGIVITYCKRTIHDQAIYKDSSPPLFSFLCFFLSFFF
ncbi:hypothetical protein L873DRAFT_745195 [Choiromyces venosus 120613-1]|uniref:Uncharacterized protein n=1 Tax=Choiromyces venosus 120613-1 TaxID=1336337 RepID=A0A3N4JRN2_9PEZI|nr:hypothetical protein L873DRAFT_745195 [Choiromyces venosus 120613-1]